MMTTTKEPDLFKEPDAHAAAFKMMDSQGLARPPVPENLAAKMQQLTPHLFATCDLPDGLYQIDQLADNAAAGRLGEFVAFGFQGHGIQSWAFHYALVEGALAVFLQLQWGGVYVDEPVARGRIESALAVVDMLRHDLNRAAAAGKLEPAKRLVVLETDFSRSRWAWIDAGCRQPISWGTDPPVMFSALLDVRNLIETL
jgi:hypothetical protein